MTTPTGVAPVAAGLIGIKVVPRGMYLPFEWLNFAFFCSFVACLLRGADYLTPQVTSGTSTLGTVEALMPLHAWGYLFIGFGFAAAIAGAGDQYRIFAFANAGLAVLYFGVGFGILLEVADRPGWVGFRTGTGLILGAGLGVHLVLFFATMWYVRIDRMATKIVEEEVEHLEGIDPPDKD